MTFSSFSTLTSRLVGGAAALVFAAASTAVAEVHVFNIDLSGDEETPPVATTGVASCTVTIDDVAMTVTVTGSYSNMLGNVSIAHIHAPAPVGQGAGIMKFLTVTGGTTGTIGGPNDPNLSQQMLDELLGGISYLNIHTSVHGGGELRGQIRPIPTEFCNGDGGDQMGCTDCPCNNNASPGTSGGCINGAGQSAHLEASGIQSVNVDTLRFEMTGGNPTSFGLLASANNQLPNMGPCPAGSGIQSATVDGLRCIGGGLLRHGTRASDANGDIGVGNNGWGAPNGPAGGLIANGGFTAGQVRNYMVFYREDAALQCNTGQNTSNGVEVTFIP